MNATLLLLALFGCRPLAPEDLVEPEDSEAPPLDSGAGSEDLLPTRCYQELAGYIGTSAPEDALADSISEVHCPHGAGVCYEQIALYDDGMVVYQNILLEGGSVDCVQLATLAEGEVQDLQLLVGALFAQDFVELEGEHARQDPEADEYGVDLYRAQKSAGFLLPVMQCGATCKGYSGSEVLKRALDELWGQAERDITR